MARKSRKENDRVNLSETIKVGYNTAVYARLSKEDNGIDGLSIENQLNILLDFVNKHPELNLADKFVDNGQTGTNFERPAFTRMMQKVRKNEINCIVVKDLSRFGRNYLESGNYIERIFPYLGIRFISISEGIDSLGINSNEDLLMSLKSIINDNYAKDISKKVCTAIDIKKKSGKFMGKIPPYGYKRCENDRYKLKIHESRAVIIQRIFAMKIYGLGATAIARKLNDEGIPSQMKLRFLEGFSDGEETSLWHGSSVIGVLRNYYYLGKTVERKGENQLCAGKNEKMLPESDWNIIPCTHERIISDDDFFKVQTMLAQPKKIKHHHRQRTKNIFAGLIECGSCGNKFQRNSGYYKKTGELIRHSFYCGIKYVKNGGCKEKSVCEDTVKEVVVNMLRVQVEVFAEIEEIISDYINSKRHTKELKDLNAKFKSQTLEYTKAVNQKNTLYEDYKSGLLSESGYIFAKNEYTQRLENMMNEITGTKQRIDVIKEEPTKSLNFIREHLKFCDIDNLTDEICHRLIKKIVVTDGTFQIHFNYRSEYENAIAT